MTKRLVVWLLAGVFVLAILVLLVPGSPAYAPRLFVRYAHVHNGHGIGYWTDALNSPDPKERHRAIYSLGMLGEDAAEATPALADIMLNDPDDDFRCAASLALSKMVPGSRSAAPALGRALGDDVALVRMNAATALFRLHGEARPAVAGLITAVQEPRNRTNVGRFPVTIQETAAMALGRASAGSDEGVAVLIEALDGTPTAGTRRAIAQALGDIGAEAQPALPQLRALLKDDDKDVREVAREAVRKIEGDRALVPVNPGRHRRGQTFWALAPAAEVGGVAGTDY